MPVTKQTYTAAANWTAVGFANIVRDAFIGAGLMTAWYDSFVSGGVENRVLEIQYNSTKSYGKCYYWFMFTTSQLYLSIATQWDTAARVPAGTQFLDYVSLSTNTTNNHWSVLPSSLTTGTQLDIVRYTSGASASYSWFVIRNGAIPNPFFIAPASSTVVPWLDLNKFFFHHFVVPTYAWDASSQNAHASIRFIDTLRLRRSYRDAQGLKFITDQGYYGSYNQRYPLHGYRSTPNWQAGTAPDSNHPHIAVPYGFSEVNTAFTANYTPVIFGYSYSPYVQQSMPVDFGLQFSYLPTTFSFGDRVVVTAGAEEWEVLDFRNNNTNTSGSPLLLARVV